uniref:Uncharacterized protein n=1 Tax=Anguilla anguilla TaxID=7936 RepID=A0A0E9WXL5_ANGAN
MRYHRLWIYRLILGEGGDRVAGVWKKRELVLRDLGKPHRSFWVMLIDAECIRQAYSNIIHCYLLLFAV